MLGGAIESVQGLISAFRPQEDPSDTLLANLRFRSGAVGHLTYSVGVLRDEPYSYHVHGTRGALTVAWKAITLTNRDGESTTDLSNAPSGYLNEFIDFHEAIVNGQAPAVSPRDAFADLALIDATFRSSQSATEVHLSTP
jgi:predicted dehydrogenase